MKSSCVDGINREDKLGKKNYSKVLKHTTQ
jgi:hypothetical protein